MENPTIGLALIAGLLSFISPCVLPLVPAYIGYMGGRMTRTMAMATTASTGEAKSKADNGAFARANMLLHAVVFVAGFTVVFVALGIATTALVSVLGGAAALLTDILARAGGVIIIALGLHYMGILPSLFRYVKNNPGVLNVITSALILILGSLLMTWAFVEPLIALPLIAAFALWLALGGAFTDPNAFWLNLIERIELLLYTDTRGDMQPSGREGLGGSFMMGIVFSAGWTPCIGPLYGAILTVAATTGEVGSAMPLLGAYSLGLGIPFILTALALDSVQGLLRRMQKHMRKVELVSGALLVLIGLLVASGQLLSLSQNLGNQFADLSFRVEECGVGFADGQINIEHVGSCLGGTLHLVAINQSGDASFEINTADRIEHQFVFNVDDDTLAEINAIDVDVTRITAGLQPAFTLYNPANEIIASSETLFYPASDEVKSTGIALNNISLSSTGIYRLVVTANTDNVTDDDTARIRVKVVTTRGDVVPDVIELNSTGAASVDEDSALGQLAQEGLNSIEGVVETLPEEDAAETIAVGLDIGQQAPDFSITTIEDDEIQLSDLRGDVVLINFWGTWCGPCRREMPEFQEAFEEYDDEGFTVLALAARDTRENVEAFRDEFGLTFPLALDANEAIADKYAVQGFPNSLILDEDGVILWRSIGIVTKSQIEPIIQEAIAS